MNIIIFDNDKSTIFGKITHMINMGESIVPEAVRQYLLQVGEDITGIKTMQYFGECNLDEPGRLIVVGHFGRQYETSFMKNSNVTPLFISFGWKDYYLTEEEVSYFKTNEPILCRDEFTRNVMRQYGIEAYLFGCITLSLPGRLKKMHGNKYYFVDVAERFLKLVPDKILKDSVITSQNIMVDDMSDSVMYDSKKIALNRLKEYQEQAKMVITSKLHCMTPCVAMGIPTIAVGDNFSYRYSYIDKFVESYSLEEFKNYNWKYISEYDELDKVKQLQIEIGRYIFQGEYNLDLINELDSLLMKRNRWNYLQKMHKDIECIVENTPSKKVIIWGASSGGYTVSNCIKKDFPELNIVEIVDTYAEGIFAGKIIIRPEEAIRKHSDVPVIICTLSGMESAKKYLEENNRCYYIVHENM